MWSKTPHGQHDQVMRNTTTVSMSPQNDVDSLMHEVADEAG